MNALYALSFTYLVQGHTRRAIRTLRRAQTMCVLPGVIRNWAEETRRLGVIAPNLIGRTEFLDALEHTERTRQRIPEPIESMDEGLGRGRNKGVPQADLKRRIQGPVSRLRQELRAATIEVCGQGVRVVLTSEPQMQVVEIDGVPNEHVAEAVNVGIKKSQEITAAKLMEMVNVPVVIVGGQLYPVQEKTVTEVYPPVHISLPYVEGSIEKVSYNIQGEYFNLTIILSDGLLFSEKDVIFTKGDNLPVLKDEQIKEMERAKDNTITKFIISVPYKLDSIEKASYKIADNYMHLALYASITLSFDKNTVKFARSTDKESHGEQQEESDST